VRQRIDIQREIAWHDRRIRDLEGELVRMRLEENERQMDKTIQGKAKLVRLLGFSGRIHSGKTSAAKHTIARLRAKGHKVAEINFADRLKELVLELFVPVEWDWILSDLEKNKGMVLPCGMTVRQTLQWFGTDVCREEWQDVWVNAWRRRVQEAEEGGVDYVIVSDVRFPNELKAIQDMSGKVIRFLRAPHLDDQHESEIALDEIEIGSLRTVFQDTQRYVRIAVPREGIQEPHFGALIDNTNMSLDEKNKAVWKLVKERKWI